MRRKHIVWITALLSLLSLAVLVGWYPDQGSSVDIAYVEAAALVVGSGAAIASGVTDIVIYKEGAAADTMSFWSRSLVSGASESTNVILLPTSVGVQPFPFKFRRGLDSCRITALGAGSQLLFHSSN